jgi:hypothetical protein
METSADDPPRDRERATFHVSHSLLDEARDAVVHLSGPPTHLTMSSLVEDALRHEIERLRQAHMGGKPFPKRKRDPRAGRPVGS